MSEETSESYQGIVSDDHAEHVKLSEEFLQKRYYRVKADLCREGDHHRCQEYVGKYEGYKCDCECHDDQIRAMDWHAEYYQAVQANDALRIENERLTDSYMDLKATLNKLEQALAKENYLNRDSERTSVLQDAAEIISKDRNVQYGNPEDNFADIAKMWEVILKPCIDPEDVNLFIIEPHKVAQAMIAVKLCRINQSPGVRDHWVDTAGYAGCGYQAVLANEKEKL